MISSIKLPLLLLFTLTQKVMLSPSSHKNVQPNIVMILADDMGFDDVSFRGNKEFLTPNIDALAYHGKLLDQLYGSPMCTPSRGALLTGRYPIHTGTQHFVISNESPWALGANVTTIAEIFQKAGYSTNLIGKWHLGYYKKELTPTYRGFDYHYGYWGSYIDYYQRRAKMPVAGFNLGYDFRRNMDIECAERGTYVTDLLTREAVRVIASNNGTRPLFLVLSHLAPHTANEDVPLQAPEEEVRKFMHIKDPQRRIYAAMISKLDTSVGHIVRALDRNGLLENAIVIFQSDNGAPSVGQFSNTGSNWPFRGQKNTPFEGAVRVAGAIWSPLLKSRGTIWRQPFYIGDWLPTLATAAGIKLDAHMDIDGINLWQSLSNENIDHSEVVEREIVHSLDDIWNTVSYMRGKWKYINGTTLNGNYDNVLMYREEYDTDPRESNYVIAVRNSLTSHALRKYDEQRLTRRKIENLRNEAAVKCGFLKRSCNALVEECLFNLALDPCEQNNLAHELEYTNILDGMRAAVESYRRSAWPPNTSVGLPEYDPTRHYCTWTTFGEEPPTKAAINCDYFGTPCEA